MTNPLFLASFANIFSYSVSFFFFQFVYGFCCCAKAFEFNRVPLVYFCFHSHYSGGWCEKDILNFVSEHSAMFSCKSFTVFGLTFRSLIHLNLFFCMLLNNVLKSFFLHVAVQFPPHHLLTRMSFLHYIVICPLSQINDHRCVGLFLSFLSCSIDLYFYFYTNTILSWLLQLCTPV